MGKSELFLPLTFPTGQTLRWKQTCLLRYTCVIDSHLISLRQQLVDDVNGDRNGVFYFVHSNSDKDDAKAALENYLNAGISLNEMWETFSAYDLKFVELALHLGDARVLRQDSFECLIQFLCSSNNNIGRITKMVDFVLSLGKYLGTVEEFKFYEFPSPKRLASVSEDEFRVAGFGYRLARSPCPCLLDYCINIMTFAYWDVSVFNYLINLYFLAFCVLK
ncbi:hypothetical protein MKX03_010829 [Papaver bracteatum]|nr:hypothetical protein MKX03_010829 [Papaver bracteatum]